MVIFHSYVKLPEGIYYMFPTSSNDFQNDVMLSELHGAQSSEATARSLRPAETSSPFGRVKTAKSPRMFSIFYGYLWVCFPSLSIYIYIYIHIYLFQKKYVFFLQFFCSTWLICSSHGCFRSHGGSPKNHPASLGIPLYSQDSKKSWLWGVDLSRWRWGFPPGSQKDVENPMVSLWKDTKNRRFSGFFHIYN